MTTEQRIDQLLEAMPELNEIDELIPALLWLDNQHPLPEPTETTADEIIELIDDNREAVNIGFYGTFHSTTEFAEEFYRENYEIPEHLEPYIDYSQIWYSLLRHDFWDEDYHGDIYIFHSL